MKQEARMAAKSDNNKARVVDLDQYWNQNNASEVSLQMIMISKDTKDKHSESMLFILQNYILMKLGVSYLSENLHQLINEH